MTGCRGAGSAFSGLVFGGLARISVANQAAWCVGSICHAFGSRPFGNGDKSTNSWWVAVLTFGEASRTTTTRFPGPTGTPPGGSPTSAAGC